MPLSSEKKDWILRLIQQVAQMMARLMARKREGDLPGALAEARTAAGTLLGPMAGAAQAVDSVTAAHMVGDPDVIAAWAEVLAEEADVHRLMGDVASAAAAARRALELAVEAHLRFLRPHPEVLERIAALRAGVDEATLAGRHREALAALPSPGS